MSGVLDFGTCLVNLELLNLVFFMKNNKMFIFFTTTFASDPFLEPKDKFALSTVVKVTRLAVLEMNGKLALYSFLASV